LTTSILSSCIIFISLFCACSLLFQQFFLLTSDLTRATFHERYPHRRAPSASRGTASDPSKFWELADTNYTRYICNEGCSVCILCISTCCVWCMCLYLCFRRLARDRCCCINRNHFCVPFESVVSPRLWTKLTAHFFLPTTRCI